MSNEEKDPTPDIEQDSAAIQLQKLELEITKLKAETANLKNIFLRFIPVISGLLALSALAFGVYQYTKQEKNRIDQQALDSQTAANNFKAQFELAGKVHRGMFYQKQLEIYLDVSETVSKVAVSNDVEKEQEAYSHFLDLYNGKLRVVKIDECGNQNILSKAENFMRDYKDYKKGVTNKDPLIVSAHNLSTVLRNSLICYWGIGMEAGEFENTNTRIANSANGAP